MEIYTYLDKILKQRNKIKQLPPIVIAKRKKIGITICELSLQRKVKYIQTIDIETHHLSEY